MVSQVLELRGVTRVLRSSLAELKRERSAHEFWALAQPGALEPRLPRLDPAPHTTLPLMPVRGACDGGGLDGWRGST